VDVVPLTISALNDVTKAAIPTLTITTSMSLGDGGSGVGKTVANRRKATAMTAEDANAKRAHM